MSEYWLFDLDAPSLTCFRRGEDGTCEQLAERTGEVVAHACGFDVPIDAAVLDQR